MEENLLPVKLHLKEAQLYHYLRISWHWHCIFIQLSPDDAIWSFHCIFICILTLNPREAMKLPDCGKFNSAPRPRDGVRGVMVTKTGSGAIVVSAKSERKNGISVQNTNQLAGNRTFIILLTLISFQGKCPDSPLSVSLSLSPLVPFFRRLSLTQTNSRVLHVMMVTHPNCLPACLPQQQITAAMSKLAPGFKRSWGQNVKHSLMTNVEVWLWCWKTVYRQG